MVGEPTVGRGPVAVLPGAALVPADGTGVGTAATAGGMEAGAGAGRQVGKVGRARAGGKGCYPSGRHGERSDRGVTAGHTLAHALAHKAPPSHTRNRRVRRRAPAIPLNGALLARLLHAGLLPYAPLTRRARRRWSLVLYAHKR